MSKSIPFSARSWVHGSELTEFPIQNLPFGIFSEGYLGHCRVGVAIGEWIIDLSRLHALNYLSMLPFENDDFRSKSLNKMMMRGKKACSALRLRIADLLDSSQDAIVKDEFRSCLVKMSEAKMHLPVEIGDYTDFYSSEDHARNVGMMFRDPAKALLPNWKHLPVGYHGRASSIVISGTPIVRPCGQVNASDETQPSFGPTKQLDFELEMAFITFDGKPMGERISTAEADDYIFGMVLFNDWSARDIQRWEYVPLGPFLAKNFASTVSPWVVTLDALEPFRTLGPLQDPEVLPYLQYTGIKNIDINLQVAIQPENGNEVVVSNSNYKHMYWNMNQQLAHHTVGGCNMRCGDMLASGTISGPTEGSFGSMLEIAWKGTKPVDMGNGTTRNFIHDGDVVVLRGYAEQEGIKVGFGECSGKVLPAKD
ncbi:MAG: fumarylacetoacetase [Bacteroidota bacterium]|jgi:fumarylacetoacetase